MRRTKGSHKATVLGATAFAIMMLVGLMFFAGFWTTGSTYSISAYVYNARGIATDSTVFEAGLPVGLVTGVRRNGADAILTLRIDHGPTPLSVDSQIQLGLRSLAGEADVLLHLGHSKQTVRDGGSLGLSQDQDYTEVDQILNEFAGPAERNTRQFFQGVGAGVRGEGQNLNQTLGAFASLVNDSPPLTSTIAAQHNQVADIVQNFGNIMGAIGQRTQALDEFAQGALTTFNDVAARDTAMNGLLAQLPFAWSAAYRAAARRSGPMRRRSRRWWRISREPRSSSARAQPADARLEQGDQARRLARRRVAGAEGHPRRPAEAPALRQQGAAGGSRDQLPGRPDGSLHRTLRRGTSPRSSSIRRRRRAVRDERRPRTDREPDGRSLHPLPRRTRRSRRSATCSPPVQLRDLQEGRRNRRLPRITPPGNIGNDIIGGGTLGPTQFGATHTYPHVTQDCSK